MKFAVLESYFMQNVAKFSSIAIISMTKYLALHNLILPFNYFNNTLRIVDSYQISTLNK